MPHLAPLTDPLAIDMENGDRVIYDNLTEDFRLSSVCFLSAVTEAGGTYDITSLYRPQEYQQHLREVWNRYWRLVNNTQLACSQLRNQVISEFQSHQIGQPARRRSPHTMGIAMDVTVTLPAGYNVDTLANNCGLHRPIVREPWHFELQR